MEASEIFASIAIVVGLATVSQLVARLIKLPALLLLLPAGFFAGAIISFLDPAAMFDDLFSPLVGITVALILFHGGLELFDQPMVRTDHRVVRRLVWIGGPITWAAAALAAYWLFDITWNIAILLGAILIVSGPTVVGPLLEFIQPQQRVRRILAWEGTLVDPVGALIAVIIFSGVQASDVGSVGKGVTAFLVSLLVGVVMAAIGVALIWGGLILARGSDVLGTQVLFGSAILMAGLANAVADDAGLLTALLMGMATPKVAHKGLPEIRPFFDTLVNISIGVLFVAISASVTPSSLRGLVLPAVALVAILVLVVRPAMVWLLTMRSSRLSTRERIFIGWMAPRGIVAAATAASFSAALIKQQIPTGDKLLPITFLAVAGTVTFYSLTAAPVARLLKVREADHPEEADPPADPPEATEAETIGQGTRQAD
ncbi:MAG: cation:proton antiporter [Actinobacteria bacterium]|nr:cation:proton antiporter [Actinomycetota bacterium]MCB9411707.1 cation:proton antiporter [Actinomycetota bacterium]